MTRMASGEHPFFRELVLSVLAMADGWLKAREVSELTGLTYKQTIDALNYLYNAEKVLRTGRKFTAMWGKLELEKDVLVEGRSPEVGLEVVSFGGGGHGSWCWQDVHFGGVGCLALKW